MKSRSLVLTTTLAVSLLLVSIAPPATAFGRHHHGAHGDCHAEGHRPTAFPLPGFAGRMVRVADQLELTHDQRQAIWAILDQHRDAARTQLETLLDARKQLRAAGEGPFDETRTRALADTQGQAIAELILIKTKVLSQIRGVLTPEQREKLAELRPQRGFELLGRMW